MSEAKAFGRYIVGREITERAAELYARALADTGETGRDAVAIFAAQHEWSVGPLDAALALVRPGAPLRRRLLLMAAILEAQTDYCDDFLPLERRPLYAARIAAAVLRNAVQAACGLVLLPFLR